MKKSELRQIIKEEIKRVLKEDQIGTISLLFRKGAENQKQLAEKIFADEGIEFVSKGAFGIDIPPSANLTKDSIRDILSPKGVVRYIFATTVGKENMVPKMTRFFEEAYLYAEESFADFVSIEDVFRAIQEGPHGPVSPGDTAYPTPGEVQNAFENMPDSFKVYSEEHGTLDVAKRGDDSFSIYHIG